jgi:hypothetical protein
MPLPFCIHTLFIIHYNVLYHRRIKPITSFNILLVTVTFVSFIPKYVMVEVKVKVTLVQALRRCTGHTDHRGSRGIALLFHDQW